MVKLQRFVFLILTLVTSSLTVAGQPSNLCSDEQPYEFQTSLKNGYRIVFGTDRKEFKSLYLYQGRRRIAEVSSVSCGMPHKNLGYVGADFRDYFVLVHSFGSGNPNYIQLIRKSDGKDRIKSSSAWIDADEKHGLLIYSEDAVPEPGDRMKVLDLRNFRVESYRFPSDMFDESEVLNRITDVTVGRSRLKVSYRVGRQVRTKSYLRPR
jgi:hypothetical protein